MNTPRKLLIFLICTFPLLVGYRANLKKVCLKHTCIQAEVVVTIEERQRGLMYREALAQDQGMLFSFENEAKHGFWMKNMSFPLDIIWIDSTKKVVYIYKNALPCKEEPCVSILPQYAAKYVLEVNAGFSDAHRINIGDKVNF